MNNNQKLMIRFLSDAIRDRKANKVIIKTVALRALFNEASEHHVQTLLFPIIKDLDLQLGLNKKIMQKWRKDVILHAIIQTIHINQMLKVLKSFNEAYIPVIILKGLMLRELYPTPEFRIMTDADILVHKEDVDGARELLIHMGYNEGESTSMHICFEHSSHLTIELHWKLTDDRYIRNIPYIEDSIWENAEPYKFRGLSCEILSPENQLLYLCMHMFSHIAGSGFGIRQICDFVLYFESKGSTINWPSFNEKVKECGIEKFVTAIFIICNKLFEIKTPDIICCKSIKDDHYLALLINDIISGGIYGKRTLARMYGQLSSILFLNDKDIPEKYSYVKKHILLKPAAWVHHLISGLCNKNYKLNDKLRFLFTVVPVSRRRTKLLHWLKLQ